MCSSSLHARVLPWIHTDSSSLLMSLPACACPPVNREALQERGTPRPTPHDTLPVLHVAEGQPDEFARVVGPSALSEVEFGPRQSWACCCCFCCSCFFVVVALGGRACEARVEQGVGGNRDDPGGAVSSEESSPAFMVWALADFALYMQDEHFGIFFH